MAEKAKSRLHRAALPLVEFFGLSPKLAVTVLVLAAAVVCYAVFWFFSSAPPSTIIITAGAPGSSFETNAIQYRDRLARKNIKVKILPSAGSLENLERLNDAKFKVDVGFIQGGITNSRKTNTLVSLGSIAYAPLLVFYKSDQPVELLSGFSGKRLAVGSAGSGTRMLALQLLALNGIAPGGSTTLLDLDADQAADALIDGKVDAVFSMGDSASREVMHKLIHAPGVHLFDFTQADGYSRRISYVNKLVLPQGSIDFGKNVPPRDINLIGPTVELIARPNLDPALSDLLIEAAQRVNGKPSLFVRRGEFPAPIEHDFPISPDATRYYTSGKKFFYRSLPFWLASLINRVIVAFVPLIVVLVPGIRAIPAFLQWRMRLRITRWYRALLVLERANISDATSQRRQEMADELDRIEQEVNKMKVPASFASQFYTLRGDIQFVRARLQQAA